MADARVAVYVDFDNVVISRYEQVHGGHAWHDDNARAHEPRSEGDDAVAIKLDAARVDLGAIVDYASSHGTLALVRAYADWSVPANAAYRRQLVDRSFDLTQMFPVSGSKNGADIRLAIDALTDLAQHADITHIVIVGGDSDYIPLAQRCKQMGRHVTGIGISGSTSRALVNACDEFRYYDNLPGVAALVKPAADQSAGAGKKAAAKGADKTVAKKTVGKKATKKAAAKPAPTKAVSVEEQDAVELLVRAARLASDKADDEWVHASGLKSQMQRMDPGFKEKTFGYKSFADFVQAHSEAVDSRTHESGGLQLRLRGQ